MIETFKILKSLTEVDSDDFFGRTTENRARGGGAKGWKSAVGKMCAQTYFCSIVSRAMNKQCQKWRAPRTSTGLKRLDKMWYKVFTVLESLDAGCCRPSDGNIHKSMCCEIVQCKHGSSFASRARSGLCSLLILEDK